MVNSVAFTAQAAGNLFGSRLVSFASLMTFSLRTLSGPGRLGRPLGFSSTVPSLGLVTVPPAVKHFPVNLSFRADVSN